MAQSDAEIDETARVDLIHQIGQYLVDDSVLLPAVPVPEHRRLAHRPARRPGRPVGRQLPERVQEPQQVGARRRHRDHHRRRAVAGVPQPDHGVLQLLVAIVDDQRPDPARGVGHHRRWVRRRQRLVTEEPDRRSWPDRRSVEFDQSLTVRGRLRPVPHHQARGKEGACSASQPAVCCGPSPRCSSSPSWCSSPCAPGPIPWPATCGSTPGRRAEKVQQYKEANGLIGSVARAVLPLARALRHRGLGQLHQGQPAGVAGDEERAGQHHRARHRRRRRRASPSGWASASSLPFGPTPSSTPPPPPGAFVGISIPPFVSAVLLQLIFAVYMTKWLGLSKPFLPTSGIYPPGTVGLRPRAAGQTPDPAGHRGGHPDHRGLQPVHAHASSWR